MGKNFSEDNIKYVISAETAEAQQNIHKLTQENKSLSKEEWKRKNQMVELEAQGKKNTQEYKNLAASAKEYSDKISENKKVISDLTSKMDLNAMSMSQLKKRSKELQSQLNGLVEAMNPKEYAKTASELEKVKSRMGELRSNGKAVNEEFDLNSSLLSKMKAAAVAFITVKLGEYLGAIGMKAYETRKEFAKYEAVLTNTLGSQEKAQNAMKMLQQLAKDSPGSLSEWTEGFIKLVNRGINPTKEQLVNMGDIAASQGKSSDQFIEALLDGITGENERLKEFGITAKKSGDTTQYTFKGVTTEVQNTDAAITKYILSLGNLKGVQGSMAIQMEQLEGLESNFGDTMDSLFNKIGKRLEPFFKNILTTGTKFISNLTNSMEPLSDQFDEQFESVVNLETNIVPLVERYDDLKKKTNLNVSEQKELNSIVEQVTGTVKSASAGLDLYGKATALNTKEVYRFIEAKKFQLKYLNQEKIDKAKSDIADAKETMEAYKKIAKEGGKTVLNKKTGDYDEIKYSPEKLGEVYKTIRDAGEKMLGAQLELNRLSGADIEKQVKQRIAADKKMNEMKASFNKMNKSQLQSWLKDEKNAASQYKDIAQEVYNSQFGGTARGGKDKKDKTDYNAIALKNMDTLHEEQINKIKLLGAEKEQTEDEINKSIIKSDISYYSQRISKLESFIKTTKDKKKKAAYENEVVNLKTKQINDEVTLEKQSVSNLEKIRQDDLSDQDKIYKANQAALEMMLSTGAVTQQEFDVLALSITSSNAENRLEVERQYLNDVNSLELKNGQLKADSIVKANAAVMDADLANAKAQKDLFAKTQSGLTDFKKQYNLLSTKEEQNLELQVLDASYKAQQELLKNNKADLLELEKSYEIAKKDIQKKGYSTEKKQLTNSLAQQLEGINTYIADAKNELEKGLISPEDFSAKVKGKGLEKLKAYFDYYSGLFSGAINSLQQAEMDNIDKKYDVEIEAAKGNTEEVARLENEKEQKKLDIQKKYADINFAIKASQIIADTAVAIMKVYADLPFPAAVVASALMGITGAAQLASANAEREKIKNMTVGGTSSSAVSGARVATGRENGGSIDIVRAQDGKFFPGADYDPSARGFIDKPTVIVGEGPLGRSREWVASNAALANPTVAPLIDIIDKSQRAGNIRTLDLNGVIRAKAAGYDKGGYIDNSVSGNNAPVINSGGNIPVALLEKLTSVLSSLDDNGVTAGVYLTDFERKKELRDKSRKIGSKR